MVKKVHVWPLPNNASSFSGVPEQSGSEKGVFWKRGLMRCFVLVFLDLGWVDERQITHLICARLKYDLYDFFRGVLGLRLSFSCIKGPKKTPPVKVI